MEYRSYEMEQEGRAVIARKRKQRKARLRRRRITAVLILLVLIWGASKLMIWGIGKLTAVQPSTSAWTEQAELGSAPGQSGGGQAANTDTAGGGSKDNAQDSNTGAAGGGSKDSNANESDSKDSDAKDSGLKESNAGESGAEDSEAGDWALLLVNKDHPVPEDYKPKITALDKQFKFDARAAGYLNSMLKAAQKEGLSPVVCSAYRTFEKQKTLFENKVKKEMDKGYSPQEAAIQASKVVASPGTSEHHLGLAVDIVSRRYQGLDDAQAKTDEMQWLMANCQEYGFILRYPKDKTDMTGVIWEPWHFRYVGQKAAREIMSRGICLEEYIEEI